MEENNKDKKARPGRWRPSHYIVGAYVVALLVSHVVRLSSPPLQPHSDQQILAVNAIEGNQSLDATVNLAYSDINLTDQASNGTVVLLHGSPMASRSMTGFVPELKDSFRLIIPDLPGLGRSSPNIPDYSVKAHSQYIVQLLDSLEIDRAHFVAYSMAGGVALELYERAPDRIASIIMLSAIGVQELELLGDYFLNHAVHGLQLGVLWFLQEGFPHFGYMDDALLNKGYARNFFDTDQRPLRAILERYSAPMLILHGLNDMQVPLAAAEEHRRIVPQSEHVWYRGGHELAFTRERDLSAAIAAFVERAEHGDALTKGEAPAERLAEAQKPFDTSNIPKAEGLTLIVLMLLLALSTLISEDLACIGAGFIVAQGSMAFIPATLACFIGIFFGDVLLYFAGRLLGRPILKRPPLKWMVAERDIARGEAWMARRGPAVIVASRFIPGSRLPTYVAAGLLNTSFWQFSFYFLLASLVWTPILVGLAVFFGHQILPLLSTYQAYALPVLIGSIILFWSMLRFLIPLFSYKGRRLFLSRWRRFTRWEFWPMWAIYPPVVIYILYLGLRTRSLTLFTAVNPGMKASGFVGESKAEILANLGAFNDNIARFRVVEPAEDAKARERQVQSFLEKEDLSYPVVLKPDVGERGHRVLIAQSSEATGRYFGQYSERAIVQEYVTGAEYGVFYFRYPNEKKGAIYSITKKQMPSVVGDGKKSLEKLILDDDRALCMARLFLKEHIDLLDEIPPQGERVELVQLGTHSRGAIFLDGNHLKTQALEEAIDRISHQFEGFFFGRYDLRVPSEEDLLLGANIKVIELNGVTSEATHIYDPKNSLIDAYRVLMKQWRLAFEIAAQNVDLGASPITISELLRMTIQYKGPRRNNS